VYLADNYDGAILDIMMPKMDGITVLKNIRAQGNDVPVLILTARSEVDDRVLGLDSGADDYLSKPFAAKELLAAGTGGSGIGLSVAQAIVQAHKGKISAENKTGNGLTITVLL